MAPRIYSNLNPPAFVSESLSTIDLTVQDASLSVGQIIEMALAGNVDFPMLIEDDSGNVFDMSKSDLTDIFPNSSYGFDEDYQEISSSPSPSTDSPTAPPPPEAPSAE